MHLIFLLILLALLIFFIVSYPKKEIFISTPTSNRPYRQAYERAMAERAASLNRPETSGEVYDNSGEVYEPSPTSRRALIYDEDHPGPAVGKVMGVPVPQGTLADYSTSRNRNWISSREPAFRTAFPYGFNFPGSRMAAPPPMTGPSGMAGLSDFPTPPRPLRSTDFFKPFGPNTPPEFPSFVGNVSAFAPVPEVITPWEKAGILISEDCSEKSPQLLNLYRRPIAPIQDLWEYNVQDLNGFVIRLDQRRFLEDGDTISHIPGKPGKWKVNMPADNKYVWV